METNPSHEGRLARVEAGPGISSWATRSSSSFLKLENTSSVASGDVQVVVPVIDEKEKDRVLVLPASSGPSDSLPEEVLLSSLFGLTSNIGSS